MPFPSLNRFRSGSPTAHWSYSPLVLRPNSPTPNPNPDPNPNPNP